MIIFINYEIILFYDIIEVRNFGDLFVNSKIKYFIITILLLIVSIVILLSIDAGNSIYLSLAIQIIMILYLVRITYGCVLYIRKQYKKNKYSYKIIMNLGLTIFFTINIIRQINLLIVNYRALTIKDIYLQTINSFSYFAMLTVPFIIILSIYGSISNIVLIKREGFRLSNLLGIIFSVINIILILLEQKIYLITSGLIYSNIQIIIKYFIDISLNTIISYWYCLALATLYCNIMAAGHKPNYDKDFVIILGAQIRKDGSLTPLLKSRVDKAIEFAKKQKSENKKNIIYIPSGGQGSDEVISESEAIKNYLLKNDIEEKNIIMKNKSTNTLQNMIFSKKIIDDINSDGKILFSTTNYHVFRSGVIANNAGIDCEGIGSPTKWYFYSNALIREFVANLFSQKKQHFVIITSINIFLLILVLIGYYYNLI